MGNRFQVMRNRGLFGRSIAGVVAVVMLSVGIGAFAMGGIESYASSESSGSTAYKRMEVADFDKIEVSGLMSVEYKQGKFPGYVELETLPGYMDIFDIKVKDGTLKLGCHQLNSDNMRLKFVVKITAPKLKKVDMSGVSSFKVEGPLSFGDEFRLKTEGIATVSFGEVTGKDMTIKTAGVSTIYMLAAELQNLNIFSEGVSDIRLKGLNVDNIDAKAVSTASIVLGGRCRNITKKEANITSRIDTNGLIVESASFQSEPGQSSSGKTMPRIP